MAEHQALVRKEAGSEVAHSTSEKRVSPRKSIGSYVIGCDHPSKCWRPDGDLLTMDISLGPCTDVMRAHFYLGGVEGTMLLAPTDEKLWAVIRGADQVVEETDSLGDSDGEDRYDLTSTASNKRARQTTAADKNRGRPSKKAKGEETRRRQFVRFRGRETGETMIMPDPEAGYIDFTDDTYTRFKGRLSVSYDGICTRIEGFKVDDACRQMPEPWSAFSEEAYERAGWQMAASLTDRQSWQECRLCSSYWVQRLPEEAHVVERAMFSLFPT